MYVVYFFRYRLTDGSSNTLSVHVVRGEEQGEALWTRSGAPSAGWEVAEVTVSSPAEFRVSRFPRNTHVNLQLNKCLQSTSQFTFLSRWCLEPSTLQALIPQHK